MKRFNLATGIVLCCILVWMGCKASAPPKTDVSQEIATEIKIPDRWSVDSTSAGPVDDNWLKSFNDEVLAVLVDEAMKNNYNLRAAASQIDIAAGNAMKAGAALKPIDQLSLGSGSTGGSGTSAQVSHGISYDISWEVDVWGRVAAGASAALASLEAAEADYEFARQSLAAQVAKAWFLATQVKMQLQFADSTVTIFKQILELTENKLEVGQASEQDVHLIKADLAGAEDIQRQTVVAYEQAVRSLEIILGRYPSAELDIPRNLPPVPPPVPAGLPAEILERRPDLVAAERNVAAAFKLTEQAEAAKMPRIVLTGGLGSASGDLGSALNPKNALWNVGMGLAAPLLNRDVLEADVIITTAQQEAAVAAYAQVALTALADVENALTSEYYLNQREDFLQIQVNENREALRLTNVKYEVGQIDLLSVLQTTQRLIGSELGLIGIRNQRLSQRVNLHLALGGSFE